MRINNSILPENKLLEATNAISDEELIKSEFPSKRKLVETILSEAFRIDNLNQEYAKMWKKDFIVDPSDQLEWDFWFFLSPWISTKVLDILCFEPTVTADNFQIIQTEKAQ